MDEDCQGCGKPEPGDWCWDGRDLDCPMGYPPRWATEEKGGAGVNHLWHLLKLMHDRG